MQSRQLPDSLVNKMKTLAAYRNASSAYVTKLFHDAVQDTQNIYSQKNGHIIVWRAIQRFALEFIAANRLLNDKDLERAISDLERCESYYDKSPNKWKATFRLLSKTLEPLLLSNDKKEFGELVQTYLHPKFDHDLIYNALSLVKKPGSAVSDDILHTLVVRLWNRLRAAQDTSHLVKRLARIDVILRRLESL